MSIAVLGARGQLGTYLLEQLGPKGIALDREALDLARPAQLRAQLAALHIRPEALINAAAYTAVDKAETERELCDLINHQAPCELALWCKEQDIPFIHYSTDYVYSGEGEKPWIESDTTAPLNHYGMTKLLGEQAVQSVNSGAMIFRTSWVYSHFRDTFVLAILKKARTTPQLTVVTDQVGSPTYAEELARLSLHALRTPKPGIYHLADLGHVARHEFARKILELAARYEPELGRVTIQPARTADFPAAAKRPLNSRLDCTKFEHTFGLAPSRWEDNLHSCIGRHYANH